jgi:hypothetical protein
MVWPDDVPPEVAAQAARQQAKEKPKLHAVPEERPLRAAAPLEVTKNGKPRRTRKPKPAKDGDAAKAPEQRKRRARPAPALAPEPSEAPKAQPAARSSNGPGSKRELPPYLRVIK